MKIPKVFANKIDKKIENNETYYVSKNEEKRVDKVNVDKKIKDLFNKSNYVYKIDVVITFKDKKETKRIVGKNDKYLITIDNERIPISEILDLDYEM